MDPATWTAISAGGPAVILIAVLLIYGIPKMLEWRDKESARDKEIQKVATELAKEGPTAVIADLRTLVNELKQRCDAFEEKSEGWQEKHHRCEVEAAEAKALIRERDCDIEDLKAENVSLRSIIAQQQEEISELRKRQGLQAENVKRIEVSVQEVKTAQEQQSK